MISALLFGCHYTDIKELLDKLRNIRDIKKNIVINFPKQKKFAILKSNQRPKRSIKGSERGFARLAKFVAGSTNIKKDFIRANQDCVHTNLKFRPTSTKFEEWIRT